MSTNRHDAYVASLRAADAATALGAIDAGRAVIDYADDANVSVRQAIRTAITAGITGLNATRCQRLGTVSRVFGKSLDAETARAAQAVARGKTDAWAPIADAIDKVTTGVGPQHALKIDKSGREWVRDAIHEAHDALQADALDVLVRDDENAAHEEADRQAETERVEALSPVERAAETFARVAHDADAASSDAAQAFVSAVTTVLGVVPTMSDADRALVRASLDTLHDALDGERVSATAVLEAALSA